MLDKGGWVYWLVVASFVMPIILSLLLIWFVTTYQKKKNEFELASKDNLLRVQKHIIEKQHIVVEERNRIASEMHDDLGSGLTTILFLSDRLKKKHPNPQTDEIVSKIESNSKSLVSNMSEIIWTMNSRFDDALNLAGYMRSYASEFLTSNDMPLNFFISDNCGSQPIVGSKRRDLFLIYKEILHNAVKHSKSKLISIKIDCSEILIVTIDEIGGKGFDPAQADENGNGLYNMKKRVEAINGTIDFQNSGDKMQTTIKYKVLS
ncbi:MAG TPA: histidine kinase [Saprospiraceae bacterium]|nr:histidine kinase [Saprospiraceae bacterium]HQW54924.1 histidine kinase [Saprospiraceae bacterium]